MAWYARETGNNLKRTNHCRRNTKSDNSEKDLISLKKLGKSIDVRQTEISTSYFKIHTQ